MSATKQSTQVALTLNETEHSELLTLLEREMRETHVEARRTESPNFQDEIHHRENVLQGLIEKLRRS